MHLCGIALKKSSAISSAKKTILLEAKTLEELAGSIGKEFEGVVQLLLKSNARIVVAGVGKSGNIGQKMVATFISTGQSATFMHAADAIHGDLGLIQKSDVVLILSKSGESPEIKLLVPLVKGLGNPIIGVVANRESYLGKNADWCLHTPIKREACPNNLAPTASTTAQLALGDALAVALMEARGFTSKDFAKIHPGGALGKKLYTKVADLINGSASPAVKTSASIQEVIIEISSKRLGATAVLSNKTLVGIITDGDLRRMLQHQVNTSATKASDIMTHKPCTIDSSALAVEAFQLMEKKKITSLIVMEGKRYAGIVHIHDILREGIF